MAQKYWNGGTDNFQTAANWGGVAPANSDDLTIDGNSANIANGLSNTGITGTKIRVGPTYSGNIGSLAAPLAMGLNTSIYFDGRACQFAYLSAATSGNSCTVNRTSPAARALVLTGVWDSVYVQSGNVFIAAGATVGSVHCIGKDARVTIEAGATITTVKVDDGVCVTAAAATTVRVYGGTLHARHTATLTYATAEVGGGTFLFHVRDGIVTDLQANAGVFTTVGDNTAKTITGGQVRKRARVDVNNANATAGALTNLGGVITHGPALTVTETVTTTV